jgi:hypothetical protein
MRSFQMSLDLLSEHLWKYLAAFCGAGNITKEKK